MSSTIILLEKGLALDALEFLAHLEHIKKSGAPVHPLSKIFGENIAIIGGGNTAVTTARAAVRLSGVKKISIIYRRAKQYMPADAEKFELALKEGVAFYEFL